MRSRNTARFWLGASALWLFAASASAQTGDPDIRNIQPFVMVIVDSSGSMERLPNCQCTTLGCVECLPVCNQPNGALNEPPANKKNRWGMLLEALTGKFTDFQCVQLARTPANGMTYDSGYTIPYHQPWKCGSSTTPCPYPGTVTTPIQLENGLLDNYAGRLRFGLMTFDGMATYAGASDLVPASDFNRTLSETDPGSFSYGGPKSIHYPTCVTDYMMDTGVRSPTATEGALIAMGSNACPNPPCDMYEINAEIQKSLLRTRTYGGTPIAGSLDDLYYYFKSDVIDTYSSCRSRYAVLITDGYPDDDYRKYPFPGCNCKAEGNCPSGENPDLMHCPYPKAEDAAYNLVHAVNGQPAQMQQLFVIGMSIGDTTTKAWLNAIASNGGSIDVDNDGNEAFFADNPATLTATLDSLFGGLSKPVSRSLPAFATGLGGNQYQISAGFQVSNDRPVAGIAPPWTGILERRRFECDGSNLTRPTLDSAKGDIFQDVLNNPAQRRHLWTALPGGSVTPAIMNGALDRGSTGTSCGASYCTETELSAIDWKLLALPDNSGRQAIVDWMDGASGSVRQGKRLGDIYHSSPTIVGPPTIDPGDDAFTLFRDSAIITERPLVMYIGTNDGILHAFSVEDYPPTNVTFAQTVHPGARLKAGEELWGFVPPVLIDNLKDQLPSHQMGMDGTAVVKDVFYSKSTTAQATDYHTVLITGMRGGGNAYIAMDVTDPLAPKFLWQFTDQEMGLTYGQPIMVQAYYEWPAGTPATLRAMAILPGGLGVKEDPGGPGCSNHATSSMRVVGSQGTKFTTKADIESTQPLTHRGDVQCWSRKGRALYFVDVETGKLIKRIFDNDGDPTNGLVLPSPISGSPTAYQDAVGTVANQGFVVDADGVLWRIDISSTDPRPNEPYAGWTMRPFHDIFWDANPDEGETTYERPILSLDAQGRLVVIVGTGDTDNFDKPTAKNRVVSLTQIPLTATPTGADDYTAAMNWELRVDKTKSNSFVPSELVTGSMALFESQLFLASFISVANTSNACDYGRGRLWSVHFTERDTTDENVDTLSTVHTFGPKRLRVVDTSINAADSGANLFNIDVATAEPNLLVQGLGTTQRATCQPAPASLNTYFSPTLVSLKQEQTPAIYIVAQASSNNDSRKRAGSVLGSLEMKVNRIPTFSRIMSWAGSID
jgi:type IV pilus assembly protein PilY1